METTNTKISRKIGVLTSTTGAAIRDICTTLKRRYPLAEILIYPTLVQGAQAAPNIVQNIQRANQETSCDVLIVGRGGAPSRIYGHLMKRLWHELFLKAESLL